MAQAKLWNKMVYKCYTRLTKVENMINMLLKTKYIGLNRYFYHQKILRHPTPACPCSHNRQSTMHVVVFCPRHTTGQVEMYYCAGIFLYRELLTKPKAAKTVTDWFIQINLLPYLSPARELARIKRGNQEVP